MKTKWGSCQRDAKRIWLNLDLAKKPNVRGGIFSAGPLQAMDFATPHLRSLCAMIGLTNFHSVICEGIEQAPEQAEKLLQQAMRQAEQLAEEF